MMITPAKSQNDQIAAIKIIPIIAYVNLSPRLISPGITEIMVLL
jgi:hypothetical protein